MKRRHFGTKLVAAIATLLMMANPVLAYDISPPVVTIDAGEYVYDDFGNDAIATTGGGWVIDNSGNLYGTSNGVYAEGAGNTILNTYAYDIDSDTWTGYIEGDSTSGINTGDGAIVVNTGYVYGAVSGINVGANGSVVSTGYIDTADDSTTQGVGIRATNGAKVVNSGGIGEDGEYYWDGNGYDGVYVGIQVDDDATSADGSKGVFNYGEIDARQTGIQVRQNNVVVNIGSIETGDIFAQGIYATGEQNDITNLGYISTYYGIQIQDDDTSTPWTDGNRVTNSGSILAFVGIDVIGDNNTIINEDDGTNLATISADTGMKALGSGNSLTNDGDILVSSVGIDVIGSNNTILNDDDGTIDSDGDGIAAQNDDDSTIGNTITNNGNIYAGDDGIKTYGVVDIHNSGLIEADSDGIDVEDAVVAVLEDDQTVYYGSSVHNETGGQIVVLASDPWDAGIETSIGDGINPLVVLDDFTSVPGFVQVGVAGSRSLANLEGAALVHVTNDDDATIDVRWSPDGDDGGTGIRSDDLTDITNNGYIESYETGISVQNYNVVRNGGEINAFGSGITAGNGNYIVNTGTILSDQELVSQNTTGVHLGSNNTLDNSGLIRSITSNGVEADSSNLISNSGRIYAVKEIPPLGWPPSSRPSGIVLTGDGNVVTNQAGGVIVGAFSGIVAAMVTNSGTETLGVSLPASNEIYNYGLITNYYFDDDLSVAFGGRTNPFQRGVNGILVDDDDTVVNYAGGIIGSDEADDDTTNNERERLNRGIAGNSNNNLTNAGTIGALRAGIFVTGNSNTIVNSGEIYSQTSRVYASDYDDGAGILADRGTSGQDVTNSGWIRAYNNGAGIQVDDDSTVINTGSVSNETGLAVMSITTGGEIVVSNGDGIIAGNGSYVSNAGLIYVMSDGHNGILLEDDSSSLLTSAFNSGTILADDGTGIGSTIGNAFIENSGRIGGDGTTTVHSYLLEDDITQWRPDYGIRATNSNNTITNTATGAIYAESIGVVAYNTGNNVTNAGLIDSLGTGIEVLAGGAGTAPTFEFGQDLLAALEDDTTNYIENALGGGIYALADDGTGIESDYNAKIVNRGLIESGHIGIYAIDYNIVENSGTIVSDISMANDTGIHVGDYNVVTNTATGLIESLQSNAIVVGSNNEVTNRGILDTYDIYRAGTYWNGLNGIVAEDDNTIINYGTIDATWAGIVAGDNNLIINEDDATIYSDQADTPTPSCGIEAGSDNVITNKGLIKSFSDTGIQVKNNNQVTNEAGGSIDAVGTGILGMNNNIVSNYGTIISHDENGIELNNNSTVTNGGTIDAHQSGIVAKNNNVITNEHGATITSDQNMFLVDLAEPACGIEAKDNNTITNAGLIESLYGTGIDVEDDNTITNSGTIDAYYSGIEAGDRAYVWNTSTGHIFADDSTVRFLENTGIHVEEDSTVINDGTIDSDYGDGIYAREGSTITNTNAVNGLTGIRLTGQGSITNSGAITGTDGIAISLESDGYIDPNQVVLLQTGSNVIGDIVDDNTQDNDTLTFDGEGEYSDDVVNIEQINKNGTGVWELNGNITYGGEWADYTNINDGTLQIDGNLGAGVVYVWQDGTLAGDGTIHTVGGNTVINYGTIAPGPATGGIGTLTIDGDLVQKSGANFDIELGPNYDNDFTNVDLLDVMNSGLALIEDDTTVTATPHGYLAGGRYTFLTVEDDLTVDERPVLVGGDYAMFHIELGCNDGINCTDAGTQETLWLDVVRYTPGDLGFTPNQKEVYRALVEMAANGDEHAQELLDLFDAQDEDGLDDIIDALGTRTGEQYPNLLDISLAGSKLYGSTVLGRMGNLHLTKGTQDLQYATNSVTKNGPALSRMPAFDRQAGGWSGWARAVGMKGDQDGDHKVAGYEFDAVGMAIGIDNQISDNFALGIGMGQVSSDVDFDGNGHSTDIDTYHGSLYGTYSTSSFYVDGAVLYASNDYDSDRMVVTMGGAAQYSSSTDGKEWGAYLGGGYNLVDDTNWYFIPTASFEWAKVDIDGFTESAGPDSLTLKDYDADSFTSTLGFRLGGKLAMGETRVEPEFRLSWAHEFGDTERDVTANFTSTPITTFSIQGVEPEADSAVLGVGINAYVSDSFTLFVDYDGEFRSDFTAHAVSGGLRYNF